jgi:4'-phosphopantetheinyl transferase EntD
VERGLEWAWAICAVLAIDLVAAGAIRADAGQRRERDELVESQRREIAELLAQRDAAREALQALTVQERPLAAGASAHRPSAPLQTAGSLTGQTSPAV